MKKMISFLAVSLVSASAIAANPSPDRRSMAQQWGAAPRAVTQTVSKNQINSGAVGDTTVSVNKSSVRVEVPVEPKPVDTREKEKLACMNNNIGVGNTFVWASRYSNTSNYASMVEDVENPENNVCFVKVELKSDDSKINVADVKPVYYEMGRGITCGSWADAGMLEKRILDAKKSGRTWGTVAGAVGGAGVGVGVMELFGNKLIGGKVQGQKSLNDDQLIRSQLAVLKDKNPGAYNQFKNKLLDLQRECKKFDSTFTDVTKPDGCSSIDYDGLLGIL